MSFDTITWLRGTSPLQQHLPAMLFKAHTRHIAPQQSQRFKQGTSPRSNQGGQRTEPLRVAAARCQGYFKSRSPTPSSGVSGHLTYAPLRQSPSKGTRTNFSHNPFAARRMVKPKAYLPSQSELVPVPPLLHCRCGSTSPGVKVAKPNTQVDIGSSHHHT